MTRKARSQVLFDGCFAHILSRSFEQRFVFRDPQDFEYFESILLQYKKDRGFFVHHYCLMNTHFHLLVSFPNLKQFSKALQQLKWQYTTYYNKTHKRQGPLWRERFKSLVIENEQYLHACGLYIEDNPVKAGLVRKPEDWLYSSSAYYILGRKNALIDSYDQENLPEGINLQDDSLFTKGIVIGSPLFKLQVSEGAFHAVSVP